MRSSPNKTTLSLIIYAGIFMLIGMIVMFAHQKREMKGAVEKEAVILALEFTPNSEQATKILNLWSVGFNHQLDHEKFLGNLHSQIYLDFPFLFAYASFFAFFAFFLFKTTKKKVFALGVLLGVLMLIGDFVENGQMLKVINSFNTGTKTIASKADYPLLRFSTWLKWGSISLSFLLFASYFFKKRSWAKWLMTLVCLFPFITGLLTFYTIQIAGGIVEPGSGALQFATVNFLAIFIGLLFLFGYSILRVINSRS